MFNERYVVQRVIEATCAIEYPRDKLQIQILDDSTDDTVRIGQECVRRMALAGHNISYLHRDHRHGFKAGALSDALSQATGEFVAIFDADFLPEPDFLRRTIQYFTDPKVGLVQTRWGHINRDSSLLTKSQAMLLDGHFIIEHIARNRSGRFMSFNGTAGIWRKSCIQDAGGWHWDTLTEDLDLSYRAQLGGWKFVYLPEVISPAELPPDMNSFKIQQFRWTKGAVQTAKKMLPAVLRAPLPLKVKVEAFFHLTNWVVYPSMVLLTLLLFPAFLIKLSPFKDGAPGQILFDLTVFNLATVSVTIFYLCSQYEIYCSWRDKLKYLPFLMSLGIG
ncbi:MAG: glycosyltransferase family 2 protein, partial [Phycisphaerae bacterium]|nr:glycosyltransferase family 2 protein [Phycisphaerae bacterium]